MTETEIILLMVKCATILLTVWIFMHLLCEEYLRALEFRGLIPPRDSGKSSESAETESPDGEGVGEKKSG